MKITQKQILQACKLVETGYRMNSGGGGVFAFLMGSYLEQFENCKVRFKVLGYGENTHLNKAVPQNNTRPSDWNKNNIYFRHVVLKVKLRGKKAFLIDSDGIHKNSGFYAGSLPISYLEPIIKCGDGWNDTFEREDIPAIQTKLKDYFVQLLPAITSADLTDWHLGYNTVDSLPPSMPKNAASKIASYKDNRGAGAGIIIKLKQGLKFASGESVARPANVKDAIAIMRMVA